MCHREMGGALVRSDVTIQSPLINENLLCACSMFMYCATLHIKTLLVCLVSFGVALEDKTYEVVGRIIAFCIVHKGPLPTFLHSQLYIAISEGCDRAKPVIKDVIDIDQQHHLSEI